MQATITTEKDLDNQTTIHRLDVTIGGQRFGIKHVIPNNTYSQINAKDAADLIQSQLWRQMMNTIEHNLRSTLSART